MGYSSALEIRQYLSEEQALVWHLRSNHYPPISLVFLQVMRQTLAAARQGDLQRKLILSTGKVVTVASVIEDVHLEAFLESQTTGDDEMNVREASDE